MKMYVGITDHDWFQTLKQANCDEVNFWKPGGQTNFKALDEGELFLFKLHSPMTTHDNQAAVRPARLNITTLTVTRQS